ncbi:MAG TPA: hypothetical protein VKC15_07970 [Gemmatimonadales bacterium]|nr:hypothetical protein [Gemmatimonadales bacterium]
MSRWFAFVTAAPLLAAAQGCVMGDAVSKFNETKARAYMASMKSDLRELADSLAAYRAKHGRYVVGTASNADGKVTSEFAADFKFAPTFDVTVRVDTSAGQWTATASHALTPKTCVLVPGGQPTCK